MENTKLVSKDRKRKFLEDLLKMGGIRFSNFRIPPGKQWAYTTTDHRTLTPTAP